MSLLMAEGAGLHRFELRLGGRSIIVFSRPGLPDWRRITPAQALLAEHVRLGSNSQVLLMGVHHGAAGVLLAERVPAGEIWLADDNAAALQAARATFLANKVENFHLYPETVLFNANGAGNDFSLLPEPSDGDPGGYAHESSGKFDAVLIDLPKGRQTARRWLAAAYSLLRPGGSFYLAGANDLGIQPTARDAVELFGEQATVLDYHKGSRIVRLVRPQEPLHIPGWWDAPGIAPGSWMEFETLLDGETLRLSSLPGVFSAERVDNGTRLLLDCLRPEPGVIALDLGCGYGLLGLALARRGAGKVDLVDIHLPSVICAWRNLALHGIQNAQVLAGCGVEPVAGRRYGHIVSNPPFHAGRQVDFQSAETFIQDSRLALLPGGRLTIVANRFIRYEKLMAQVFNQVEVLASDSRYHVMEAIC